ncbi:MAG: hypothetical protein KDA66_19170 [Planctomycetaceae bacterium]|nr:hypothetical protein [Planctomycetaceae bacterium]
MALQTLVNENAANIGTEKFEPRFVLSGRIIPECDAGEQQNQNRNETLFGE